MQIAERRINNTKMRPTSISAALFLIGIFATLLSSVVLFTVDSDRREIEFQQASSAVLADIQTTLDIHAELIEQSAAATSIIPSLSREQFSAFVSATERTNTHPAMRAISWIPIVQNDLRDDFERNATTAGFDNFQITQRNMEGQLVPSDVRGQYYPVYFIEPLVGNEVAVGFDLGSNQHRLAALTTATKTQSTVATSPIELVQRQGAVSGGFLIFSPVYLQRSGDLSGFISGVFDIDVLVQTSVRDNQSSGIDFELLDEIHDPSTPVLSGSIQNGNFISSDRHLDAAQYGGGQLALPNRMWKLNTQKSHGAFEPSLWLWAIPALGIISTIGISISAQSIERRRQTSMLLLESNFERAEYDRRIIEQEMNNQAQRTRMIDSVSHELRTPLTVIMARADLLGRKLPDATAKQRVDLESITNSATQLKKMIDSLIEYSTRDSAILNERYETTDVNDMINQVVAKFDTPPVYNRLVTNVPDPLLGVRCDAVLVRRAMIELVENAATYGDPEEMIWISATQVGTTTKFTVESSGELIPIDEGRALFDPLIRGSLFGDASRPGIGLGLAFVRSIAEIHNGEVIFEHSENGRNTFGFVLSEIDR